MATLSTAKVTAYDSTVLALDEDLADYDNGAVENVIDEISILSNVLIRIKNTAAAKTIVFVASDIGLNKGLGSLTRVLAQNAEQFYQLEAERFQFADGSVHFTLESGATGIISVVETLQ